MTMMDVPRLVLFKIAIRIVLVLVGISHSKMEHVKLHVEITKIEVSKNVMTVTYLATMVALLHAKIKLVTKIVHVMVGNLLFIMVCAAVYVEINSFVEHKNAMMGLNLISINVTLNVYSQTK